MKILPEPAPLPVPASGTKTLFEIVTFWADWMRTYSRWKPSTEPEQAAPLALIELNLIWSNVAPCRAGLDPDRLAVARVAAPLAAGHAVLAEAADVPGEVLAARIEADEGAVEVDVVEGDVGAVDLRPVRLAVRGAGVDRHVAQVQEVRVRTDQAVLVATRASGCRTRDGDAGLADDERRTRSCAR